MTIYFPSWDPDEHYERWYGKGFSEWELVKSTKPLFEGHEQPKVPTWGYFDESKPEWMEKQIDLAADHGITGFIFDWYWYKGEKFLENALEKGFLGSNNRDRLKYSIMWANHSWGIWPAKSGIAGMSSQENQGKELFLNMRHSRKDMLNVIEYCCQKYFKHDNYWKIDDSPVFSIYDLDILIKHLGSADAVADVLKEMKKIVKNNGFNDLYLLANIGCCNDNEYCCGWDRVKWAEEMGFNSVFAYNIVRTPSYSSLPDEMPVVEYDEMINSHLFCWDKIEKNGVTHFPSVTLGCDVSPRWDRNTKFPMDYKSLVYEPIVLNNTPERFGQLFKKAVAHVKLNNSDEKAIIINAWNEWTEGMFLLPEKKYGNGYLEEILNNIT